MSDLPGRFAQLNGENSFVGNQNVSGVVTALSFVGDGSGLTAVTAQSASTANYATSAGTAGSAGFASLATSAANATNATNLGGVAAGNYARLDIANAFTGDQNVAGNINASGRSTVGSLTVGGGTPVSKHVSMTFNPSFPLLKPSSCASTAYNFPGVSDGDTVALGVPNSRMGVGGILVYSAWTPSAGSIMLRVCNIDPNLKQTIAAAGLIRVDVWQH